MATKRSKARHRKHKAHKPRISSSVIGVFVACIVASSSGLWFCTHQTRPATTVRPAPVSQQAPQRAPLPIPPTARVHHDATIPPVVDGIAPVITHLNTKEPVVFLGIDDGGNKQMFELQMMEDNNVQATLFLADAFIHYDSSFFVPFVQAGSVVEDHTISHNLLSGEPYEVQKQEICGEANIQQQQFGRHPILFRPPGGDYDLNTQKAAAACGMKAVVNWIAKANGGSMQYQIGDRLRPGDIVLMHFRPEFKSDMQAFLNAEHTAGLHTELLEDWLPRD